VLLVVGGPLTQRKPFGFFGCALSARLLFGLSSWALFSLSSWGGRSPTKDLPLQPGTWNQRSFAPLRMTKEGKWHTQGSFASLRMTREKGGAWTPDTATPKTQYRNTAHRNTATPQYPIPQPPSKHQNAPTTNDKCLVIGALKATW